jgi:hypothetical protein
MKHFVGGFEAQPFSWSVVQSVLNHSQLFLSHRVRARSLGTYWRSNPLKRRCYPAAAAIGVSKVRLKAQSLVNLLMLRELFTDVQGQIIDPDKEMVFFWQQ